MIFEIFCIILLGRYMKRHGNLWQQIINYDNLYLAYTKARKGRGRLASVKRFEKDVEGNLKKLQQSLINHTFTTSTYNTRVVYEPKQRVIYILPFFPDRILQHALMNILAPIFQKTFIKDTYACIPDRGLHAGLTRAYLFSQRNKYCLKMDIKKFYPSIHHETLYKIIERKIKDKDVLWLVKNIIYSFEGDVNCPIGNLTSQWFGNIYLTQLDYFIKQELRAKDYIRYCDDYLIFSNDKRQLNDFAKRIAEFLDKKLHLFMSKCDLFHVSRGVDFLGYRYFVNYILLRKRTSKRIKRRLRALYRDFDKGQIPPDKMLSQLSSVDGYTKWANSYNFRQHIQFNDKLKEVKRCFRITQSIANLKMTTS